jgi:alkyl sulfatase BDS1-like metallo-beta-lactamase superfamily hydrolase
MKTMSQAVNIEAPKEASASVVAQHAATLQALPFSDVRDFDDASRGFLGTVENARITSPQGRVVWSLEPYGFLSSKKLADGRSSLWRQSRQHASRPVRGGARRLPGARARHRQHDADRG